MGFPKNSRQVFDEVIGDEEAELFGLSRVALRQHCMESYVCPKGKVDVRKANPVVVGRCRRWRRSAIMVVLSTRPE